MRLFFVVYAILVAARGLAAFYFLLLTLVTAPDDTSLLLQRGGDVVEWLQGNVALDLTLLVVGLLGLVLAFGWGNWRIAAGRYFGKEKLKRLEDEARRVAEEIAITLSQANQRREIETTRERDARRSGVASFSTPLVQDSRLLSKHMMEAHSIIRRLDEMGYWRPTSLIHEIGLAGATDFAAAQTCKELMTAADRIKSDVQDGLMSLLTHCELPKGTQ
ncbi:MAG: hypothetical protein ACKO56_01905 [Paracoccaceae bacterium]